VKVILSAGAARDLEEAVDWLDERVGAGDDFLDAYEQAEAAVVRNPRRFAREESDPSRREIRQVQLQRFPYSLIYWLRGDAIVVVAVAHARRRAGYWLDRLVEEE